MFKKEVISEERFRLTSEKLEYLETYEKVVIPMTLPPVPLSVHPFLTVMYNISAVPGVERSAGSVVQVDVETVDSSVVGVHRHVPV